MLFYGVQACDQFLHRADEHQSANGAVIPGHFRYAIGHMIVRMIGNIRRILCIKGMNAVGGAVSIDQHGNHLRQFQLHAVQLAEAVILYPAALIHHYQPASHFSGIGSEFLIHGIGGCRRKKRRKRRGQLFHGKAVLTSALGKQVVAHQASQR